MSFGNRGPSDGRAEKEHCSTSTLAEKLHRFHPPPPIFWSPPPRTGAGFAIRSPGNRRPTTSPGSMRTRRQVCTLPAWPATDNWAPTADAALGHTERRNHLSRGSSTGYGAAAGGGRRAADPKAESRPSLPPCVGFPWGIDTTGLEGHGPVHRHQPRIHDVALRAPPGGRWVRCWITSGPWDSRGRG